jgi:hypothetical protein
VELVAGATVDTGDLMEWCKTHIHERAAIPKHLEVLPELPKTAVGKVFKPDLRRMAISRVYNTALAEAGVAARVVSVREDKKLGLVAELEKTGMVDEVALGHVLGQFTRPWAWADA